MPAYETDVVPAVLPEDQHEDILTTLILPTWTKSAVAQDRPVVVFIAGQPGSGKSGLADLVHEVLNRRGGAVRVGSDLYKALHPAYAALMASDDRAAGVTVRPDTRRWQAEVEEYVRRHGFDAVVETALADPADFRATAAAYRQAGHRIEVVVLATPEAMSQLSVLDRYLGQVEAGGTGRFVSWANHDRCSRGLVATLKAIEAEGLADRLTVFRRDLTVLWSSELGRAARRDSVGAVRAVAAERARPWTAPETQHFCRELSGAERRIHPERISPERHLVVAQGVERAFALSEPVRRIAHVRAERPGVGYHRLSSAEHQWIFDELIVPSYLDDITPQERPVAVYVMGQPGAGKTQVSRLVRRALRCRKPTTIVGDNFKAFHPDYHQLLEENPRTAGATIRADYQAWQAQAEKYVRARRGDLVIEIAPGRAEQFLSSAAASHQAGYRVELVVVAARAADSRQGTAARYAQVLQLGMVSRFTSARGHDVCFRAVVDAVRAAEETPAVDAVMVMRRDGSVLHHNERSVDGGWERTAGAVLALATERERPYTPQEAAEFLAVQQQLRAALPQHRAELAHIASLASPLLPADLRPPRLDRLQAPYALPVPAQGWESPFEQSHSSVLSHSRSPSSSVTGM
ncbi:zeta toxin family protein [Streptomyces alboflavus]|uniref:zeta toxin family protein n=1 Tax=Streptomyces alboflavus TaxID=67267 RepID=UPI0036B595BC